MDLWHAMGISRETGLIAVACGVVAALLLAAGLVVRRSRVGERAGLHLND